MTILVAYWSRPALAISVSIAFGALLTFASTSILQSFQSQAIVWSVYMVIVLGAFSVAGVARRAPQPSRR